VRQVLGAIAQFDKANPVAKLNAAREREQQETGKRGGRKSYAEANPKMVTLPRELSDQRPRLSLRKIAAKLAEQGFKTPNGLAYSASAVASVLD
jgi:DNA invertase Pin-like site-specific DNA recombinase